MNKWLAVYDKVSRGWFTTENGGYFTSKARRSVFSSQADLDAAVAAYKHKYLADGSSQFSLDLSSSFWVTKAVA